MVHQGRVSLCTSRTFETNACSETNIDVMSLGLRSDFPRGVVAIPRELETWLFRHLFDSRFSHGSDDLDGTGDPEGIN